ncbi:MAG: hypothetical protein HQL37_01720 [Alphaproteobacteria bacterium]|nr:hypothetical protein [Alphaproteobacteria bacterium]
MPGIIAGLLAVALGLWGMTVWWWDVVDLLRGLVPIVLILVGVLALAAGVSVTRNESLLKDKDFLGDEE